MKNPVIIAVYVFDDNLNNNDNKVVSQNEYLMGEEASVPPGFRGRLAGALWGSGA